jgi:hypothetical protein
MYSNANESLMQGRYQCNVAADDLPRRGLVNPLVQEVVRADRTGSGQPPSRSGDAQRPLNEGISGAVLRISVLTKKYNQAYG